MTADSQAATTSAHVAPPPHDRILEIDALRGLCALAVMLYHYIVRYDAIIGFSGTPNPAADVDQLGLRDVSTIPVYIFFMISGFVIYMTLERVRSVTEFMVSRASRIFPVYWVAVLLTYTSWEFFPAFAYHITSVQALINLTMLQSFLYVPSVDGVYWSLGVEIVFYLWMGLLMVSGRLSHIRLFCAGWLVLSALYAWVGDQAPFYYRLVLLLDLKYAHFFVTGIVAYRIWRRRHGQGDWLLVLACLPLFFMHHGLWAGLIMSGFALVFVLLAFGHLSFLATRPLVFLGSISYALYLVHQMIGYQIISAFISWPVVGIAIASLVSLSIATLVTRLVEKPAVRSIRNMYVNWQQRRTMQPTA
jgi:peptidoglycan/LPS O-acetylase OafA/YrhL